VNSSLLYNEYPFTHDQKLEHSYLLVGIFHVILYFGIRWFLKEGSLSGYFPLR